MAEDTVAAPLGEVRQASTADTGTALTTTASFTSLFRGTSFIRLVPRNAAGAVVVKYALNPWLSVVKTTDSLGTVAAMTDGSEVLQDNDTSTTLSMNSFDTIANTDALYVGFPVWVRGVRVIIGNTNSNASVLTVKYWQSATPNAWASISATDGTAGGGATFNATGNVTWTVPTDGLRRSLNEIITDQLDPTRSGGAVTAESTIDTNARPSIFTVPLFWTRWETSAAFDATVTVTGMQAMNRSTTYDALLMTTGIEMRVNRGLNGLGCVEHLTDAGTANLIVSCGVIGTTGKLVD